MCSSLVIQFSSVFVKAVLIFHYIRCSFFLFVVFRAVRCLLFHSSQRSVFSTLDCAIYFSFISFHRSCVFIIHQSSLFRWTETYLQKHVFLVLFCECQTYFVVYEIRRKTRYRISGIRDSGYYFRDRVTVNSQQRERV
ncbi:hypothetical protein QTP88_010619 [Uroleucon formosanum]